MYAGSRFTKPAESRYAPIEGEPLAVAYGLKQCKSFVMGCPNLIVAVDHKPLINILNNRALEKIENPRVLRLKENTLMFDFKIVHVPGKLNCISDVKTAHAECNNIRGHERGGDRVCSKDKRSADQQ